MNEPPPVAPVPPGAPASSVPPPSALVTGASGGIGRAIAARLAGEGYALTLTGRRADELVRTVAELTTADSADPPARGGAAASTRGGAAAPATPPAVRTCVADLAVEEQVRQVAQAHAEAYGGLRLLVLAAGIGAAGGLADYPVRRLDRQFTVNVRSAFLLVQECLPMLRDSAAADPRRGSRVVAIASIAGVVAEPALAAYGASKAALISLCESVAVEEAGRRVTATAISPAYVDTEMTRWVRDRVDPADMIAAGDVAELVVALGRLSANAVVPHIVLARRGTPLWRA